MYKEKTKIIEFTTTMILEIPIWVKWITFDDDGTIIFHEDKPKPIEEFDGIIYNNYKKYVDFEDIKFLGIKNPKIKKVKNA